MFVACVLHVRCVCVAWLLRGCCVVEHSLEAFFSLFFCYFFILHLFMFSLNFLIFFKKCLFFFFFSKNCSFFHFSRFFFFFFSKNAFLLLIFLVFFFLRAFLFIFLSF